MPSIADAMDCILLRPLDYIHPLRLASPAMFDTPEAKAVLNRVLNEHMGSSVPRDHSVNLSSTARLLIRHWSLLPLLADVIGAHFHWAKLAQGAALQRLSESQRAFARIVCGPRASYDYDMEKSASVDQHVQAAGLNALMAWSIDIPTALIERLYLQFSPSVVDLQQRIPAQHLNPTLFFLAVQHARIHQNAG